MARIQPFEIEAELHPCEDDRPAVGLAQRESHPIGHVSPERLGLCRVGFKGDLLVKHQLQRLQPRHLAHLFDHRRGVGRSGAGLEQPENRGRARRAGDGAQTDHREDLVHALHPTRRRRVARMLGLAAVSVFLLLGASVEGKVNVVATTGDLGALAREVGGEHVDVKVLARPTQDPHFVDARPNLVLDVSNAHLLIINGLELEVGWLRVVITSARNPEVQPGQQGYLDASTLIQPKEVPRAAIDRSMGDLHTGGNPHYTLSPRNGLLVARGIAARLQAIDPDNAKAYAANLGRVEQTLGGRIVEWEKALSPYKGADVVTYHKSWIYFVDWAGLDQVAFVEPKPGLPPNAGHVARVLAVIKQQKVPLILQEEWYPAATSEQLARLSGAKLVRVPGQTRDGQSYAEHIGQLVDATLKALRG